MSDRADFGTFGRYVETLVERMPAAYEFMRKLRDMVPGPHKIWLANPKLSETGCRPANISSSTRR
jgi:4-carboxymuconolactone decarboxylase